MKFKIHLTSGLISSAIVGGALYYSVNLLHLKQISPLITQINNNKNIIILVCSVLIFLGNIIPDIDNPKSYIGKLFLPLSYLIAFIGFLIYPILYPRKYNGIMKNHGYKKGFFIIHRFIFHTDIGLFVFFGIYLSLLKLIVINIPLWTYIFFILGYLTHLLLDRATSKMPRFVLNILFSKVTGIGRMKETW